MARAACVDPVPRRALSVAPRPRRAPRGVGRAPRAGPAWLGLVAAIPFLAGLYLSLPVEGAIRVIVYPLYSVIGVAAVVVGLRSAAPAMRRPWQLVAMAIGLIALGDIWYTV